MNSIFKLDENVKADHFTERNGFWIKSFSVNEIYQYLCSCFVLRRNRSSSTQSFLFTERAEYSPKTRKTRQEYEIM